MKKRLALTLAAAMAVSGLAGCGTKTVDKTPSEQKKTEPQELVLNAAGEPSHMDTVLASDNGSFQIVNQINEGLVRIDKDYNPTPGVAESWEVSKDGLTYSFKLRKNAKWSDGQPVTAKNFKFAWLRALDPRMASDYGFFPAWIKGGEALNSVDVKKDADAVKKIEDLKTKVAIETPDENTLKFTLAKPVPFMLGLMAFPTFFPQREDIVTKHGEKYALEAANMVYNGPFKMTGWTHEKDLVIEKNPEYWDNGKVKLTKVTWKMIKDANSFVQEYEAGGLDRIGLTSAFVNQYKGKPEFSSQAEMTTWWLNFNMTKIAAFKNQNVRLAFSNAIDRKAYVENVLKNGSLPAEGVVPPTLAGVDGKTFRSVAGKMVEPTANLEKAKKYWDDAKKELGINKLTVKFLTNDSDTDKTAAEAVQSMLQKLDGVTVEIEMVPPKVRLDRTNKKDYELTLSGWGADYNEAMTFMELWQSKSSFNHPGYSNKAYDDLIEKADKAADAKTRLDLMVQAEKMLMADMPSAPFWHVVRARATRQYVKGILTFSFGPDTDLKEAYIEGKQK